MQEKRVLAVVVVISIIQSIRCDITISRTDISLELYDSIPVNITVSKYPVNNSNPQKLLFTPQHNDIVEVEPGSTLLNKSDFAFEVQVKGIGAGHSEVNVSVNNKTIKNVYLRVTVRKSEFLDKISLAIGWLYFIAWSVSFYPQIYSNWARKSVVGLNFDFLALNIVGFTLYSIFNLGLYFIPEIQTEYFVRYPRGLNPVQVNDIVFAVHAAIACVLTIIQCFYYERDAQRVSTTARGILAFFFAFLIISMILAWTSTIHWLDFLYYCSYVKLTITLIKYMPQAYMNYKRKSTVGWSIGNIFLDFTGGILSMLQMIVNSYNYDDWRSIFGDPTKFGLGLFSVVFDIFFIVQHYILYKHTSYEIR